ncbi:uncharacterized protein [Macrobrachium rosenbergii]|uniref:uncharacterized protein n=1 Tax=Macrobrachium rosenbergii TaxID=79674 RepID=UPI0034D687B5
MSWHVRRATPARRSANLPAAPAEGAGRILRALQSQQAAIEALTRQLSALQWNSSVPPQSPVSGRGPAAVAPEKCKLDMYLSAFRSWRRSVECWLHLNKWVGIEAVMHLRLWYEAELQSTLDAKLSSDEIFAMTPSAMLDAIQELVTSSSNQAVLWDMFFSSHQSAEESIKVYFNKCLQQAIDCRFKCPSCSSDLAEYILVRKIMVGLHNPMLKRELFQSAGESMSLDELKTKCLAFEAAARDSLGGKPNAFGVAVELSDEEEPPVADAVAAGMGKQRRGPSKDRSKCSSCNRYHGHGRQACPARDVECFNCGGKGHVARCCLKGKRKSQGDKNSLATVKVSCTGRSNLPKVKIDIRIPSSRKWGQAMAVADTGAEVCVAGTQHLRLWGLSKGQLEKPKVKLVDIVGKAVPVWGVTRCCIKIGSVKCEQMVYFAKSSSCVFLSLDSCKELCLVPRDFPYAKVSSVCESSEIACNFDSVASVHPPANSPPAVASLAQRNSDGDMKREVRDSAKGQYRASGSIPTVLAPPTNERNPPFPLVEMNVNRLQEWLLQCFSATTFNTSQCPLPVMEGPPHHIHVVQNAKPVAFHTPLPVPKHWENEVKKQLEKDVSCQGIIRKVPAGEATEWCSRMVVTGKKNGQPRRTVDFQPLNAVCLRETHHTATPFDMVSNVPPHTFKTVTDAYSGFHQVELDEESRRLTTFITPWG